MTDSPKRPIGVLTFHRGANYGGFLQAWHLSQAIRNLGRDAEVINYQSRAHYQAEQLRLRGFSLSHVKGFLHHALKDLPFRECVRTLAPGRVHLDPTEVPWHKYAKVVVGSDIVWEFTNPLFGDDLAYYGALPCQEQTSFMAYAPSCGMASREDPLHQQVVQGLRRFDPILARDQNTVEFAERATGASTPIVVDPTWLGEDPEIPYRKRPSAPYALLYGLGAAGGIGEKVAGYCAKRDLRLVGVSAQCASVDTKIFQINPFEWVDLFRHATCVVTSTFHGLLYAIKYHKPVIFMEREASRLKTKIALDRCGLNDRVWHAGELWNEDRIHQALGNDDGVGIPEAWQQQSIELLGNAVSR